PLRPPALLWACLLRCSAGRPAPACFPRYSHTALSPITVSASPPLHPRPCPRHHTRPVPPRCCLNSVHAFRPIPTPLLCSLAVCRLSRPVSPHAGRLPCLSSACVSRPVTTLPPRPLPVSPHFPYHAGPLPVSPLASTCPLPNVLAPCLPMPAPCTSHTHTHTHLATAPCSAHPSRRTLSAYPFRPTSTILPRPPLVHCCTHPVPPPPVPASADPPLCRHTRLSPIHAMAGPLPCPRTRANLCIGRQPTHISASPFRLPRSNPSRCMHLSSPYIMLRRSLPQIAALQRCHSVQHAANAVQAFSLPSDVATLMADDGSQ
ncbi:hypothetical protein B0H14DRAFT_1000230, partial [Mycena olivaceomarginata]